MTHDPNAHFTPMAKQTPGELLLSVLDAQGINRAEFGRRMGSDFQLADRWTRGRGFNAANRRKAAAALGLPPEYFDNPDRAVELENQRRRVFAEFRVRPFGRDATEVEVRFLEAIPFREESIRPSVAFYELNLAALRGGVGADSLQAAILDNEAIDRSLAKKRGKPVK